MILNAHVQQGFFDKIIRIFKYMNQQGIEPDKFTFLPVLKASGRLLDLEHVRLLHLFIIERSLQADTVIGSAIVDIYSKYFELEDALHVFDHLSKKDIVTWNAMIGCFVKCGDHSSAFDLMNAMMQLGLVPNDVTFCYLLRVCASLKCPNTVKFLAHDMIIKQGLESITMVTNSLVDMYAKCGHLDAARKLFGSLACKDVVIWNVMIAGYVHNGNGLLAIQLFTEMQRVRAKPDKYTFASSLQACAMLGALDVGLQIHFLIVENELDNNVVIKRMLIDMYAKCGNLSDGCKIFGDLQNNCDVASWNSLASGYIVRGDPAAAVLLYEKMQKQGLQPDDITYTWALKAYAAEADFSEGMALHDEVIKKGFETSESIGSSLVEFYACSKLLDDGRKIFDNLPVKDLVLWNVLITAYMQAQMPLLSLQIFEKMQVEEMQPDNFTFSCVIKACGDIKDMVSGRFIHDQILKSNCQDDLATGNSLVEMYGKFGNIEELYSVFQTLMNRDVITWNTVISVLIQQGMCFPVLELFERMQDDTIDPDEVTYINVLKVCTSIGTVLEGRLLHDQILRHGFDLHMNIKNQIVQMYIHNINLQEGYRVSIPMEEDSIQCDSEVDEHNLHETEVLCSGCSLEMCAEIIQSEKANYLAVLNACSSFGAIAQGMLMHDEIIRYGHDIDLVVGSTLIHFYAECGKIGEARTVFDMLPNYDVVCWNTMIAGYTRHGEYLEAKRCLEAMGDHGLIPDVRTYCSILAACGRTGEGDEGNKYLKSMEESFGVLPDRWHFTCMIDLLCREGKLDKAGILLRSSPFSPDVSGQRALLSAYRSHGDKSLGRECYDTAMLTSSSNSSEHYLSAEEENV
ncbi:hypothetical protein KP509_32G026200 [Ceratopteris richardii]|nr:hypothetical protein KP509_32G026200 [Ceratopteris richardii]